jgi:hypothetical protein
MTEVKRVFKVNGKPFFPVGGQSSSSSAYNDTESIPAFEAVKLLHGNTLLTDVYWEVIEPEEGKFDFSSIDRLIANARRYGVKLILLWFATWKNGNMDYAPAWVKSNSKRFKRVLAADGSDLWVLSSYCKANLEADKKAFAALCKYLKARDGAEQTVIGLQVENEVGITGDDRDYSAEAEAVFENPVPAKLLNAIKTAGKGSVYDIWKREGTKKSGTWPEVFGTAAGEFVSAWSIANYVDSVAAAGQIYYDIPMYINAAVSIVNGWREAVPDEIPGNGMPVPKVLDIYKWFTPHIALVAPDIKHVDYRTYEELCAVYARDDNPLFMPETPPLLYVFQAIAKYNLLGFHRMGGLEAIAAKDGTVNPESKIGVDTVRCIASVIPLLLKYQGTGKIHAVIQEEFMSQQWLNLDGYLGRIQFGTGRKTTGGTDWRHMPGESAFMWQLDANRGRGLVIQTGRHEFYLAGANYRLFLRPKFAKGVKLSTAYNDVHGRPLRVDEGHFDEKGKFIADRRRNGDNVSNGLWVEADIGVLRVTTCD